MRSALVVLASLAVLACSEDTRISVADGGAGALASEAGDGSGGHGATGGRGGGGVPGSGGKGAAGAAGATQAAGGAQAGDDGGADASAGGAGPQGDAGAADAGDAGRRCDTFAAPDASDAGAAEWVPTGARCDEELAGVFYPYHRVTSEAGPVRLCLVAGAARVCSPPSEASGEFSVPASDVDGLRAAFEAHATVLDIVVEYPGGSLRDNGFVALAPRSEVTRYVFRLSVEQGTGWLGLDGSVSVRGAF